MSLWKLLTARWGAGAGEVDDVHIDPSTNALITTEYEHHEVHDGNTYTVHRSSLDLTAGMDLTWLVSTPNTASWAHVIFEASINKAGYIDIYENPTVTSTAPGGETFQTPINKNRNSSNSAAVAVRFGASATNVGAYQIDRWFMGSSGKGVVASLGGDVRAKEEWVLKPNEDYLFRLFAQENTAVANMKLTWYEHTDEH